MHLRDALDVEGVAVDVHRHLIQHDAHERLAVPADELARVRIRVRGDADLDALRALALRTKALGTKDVVQQRRHAVRAHLIGGEPDDEEGLEPAHRPVHDAGRHVMALVDDDRAKVAEERRVHLGRRRGSAPWR